MMKPGPDLDAMVAEKVMGWDEVHFAPEGNLSGWGGTDQPCWVGHAPGACLHNTEILPYSTDLTTCAAAAEEARKAGKITAWRVGWDSVFDGPNVPDHERGVAEAEVWRLIHSEAEYEHGESPAHALSLALLKACGG